MSSTRKVLVVGDSPAVKELVEQALSGKGYAIVAASSGEDALWQLAQEKFDAVFAEAAQRGMSALEAAEEACARQLPVPFVIVGGDTSAVTRARAKAAGVAELLAAPVSADQLAQTAERVLQSSGLGAGAESRQTPDKTTPAQELSTPALRVRNMLLFLLAPFIGLIYLLTFPIVGLGTLAWWAFQAKEHTAEASESATAGARTQTSVLNTLVMMFAVGFSGIVFAVLGPILGIGLVIWISFQAWGRLGAKVIRD